MRKNEEWPKPLSEFKPRGISNPFTITFSGKKWFMEKAYENYINAEKKKDKMDQLYSFFIHSLHLYDWVKHMVKWEDFKSIWAEYETNKFWRLGWNFTNKTKHFRLTKFRDKEDMTNNVGLMEESGLKNDGSDYRIFIRFDQEYIPVDVLMEELIHFWNEFFRNEMNGSN